MHATSSFKFVQAVSTELSWDSEVGGCGPQRWMAGGRARATMITVTISDDHGHENNHQLQPAKVIR